MVKVDKVAGLDEKQALEQLQRLKLMTKTTGVLHEAQVLQLRMWAMLAVSHSALFPEIHFSWEFKEIEFVFKKLKKKDQPKDLTDRLKNMVNWVHWLLGDEYLVRIKDDKGVLHRGLRVTPVEIKTKNKKVSHNAELYDGEIE